jgi:hypothetical protein
MKTRKQTAVSTPAALRRLLPEPRAELIVSMAACAWLGFGTLAPVRAAPADQAVDRANEARSTRPEQVEQIPDGALPTVEAPASARGADSTSVTTAAAPLDLITSFDAIPYTGWIPPDPIIAAGPAVLVAMVNQQIAIYDKQGTKLFQQSLAAPNGFWKAQKTSSSVGDPWVVYDPHANRFLAIAADFGNKVGFLYLAVSKTSTPTGSADWHKYALNLTGTHVTTGGATFPDYPKLGLDSSAIYITANHFGINGGGFSHNKITAIEKAPLLAGGPVNIVYEQSFTTLFGPLHPAMVFDPASPMCFVTQDPNVETVSIYALANVLTAPALTVSTVFVPAFDQPLDVPQPGGGEPLDAIGSRFMSGVVRDGSLWTAHATSDPAVDGEAVVRWYQFDVTGLPASAATLIQSGNVDPGPGLHTWMTHVNVDASGNMGITFSIAGPIQYAAIGYTGRQVSDPPGTTRPVRIPKAGTVNYQRVASDGRNRWGDYCGLAIDPDGSTFWLFHEYPSSATSWQTWVGAFQVEPSPLPPVADAGPDQTVTDTDGSGSELLTLDGSGSFDPDGTIVAYEWSQDGTVLGTTPTLDVDVAVGTWTVTLTVTDNDGATDIDTVQLTVTSPTANASHCGDLDGSAANQGSLKWKATVTVVIHDASENPAAGATVSAQWSAGATGTATTGANGQGTFTLSNLSKQNTPSVTLTITSVTHPTLTYNAGANHDPDGDSNGTSITVNRP